MLLIASPAWIGGPSACGALLCFQDFDAVLQFFDLEGPPMGLQQQYHGLSLRWRDRSGTNSLKHRSNSPQRVLGTLQSGQIKFYGAVSRLTGSMRLRQSLRAV